ncbi:hypothetical protein EWM64_g8611 [Hericium alpestre]|uniref:Nuclease Le1 n=1 Tax=Hericium alpestre TaxID=135208 RepID=A0A4Y9ZNI1_9AGAM|nr:hypothetical protein EWM64_g8611 [Hericium alpestre]
MRYAPQLVCALVLALPKVAAWGNLGHETVGYVAMQFIGSKTLSFVQTSLGSQYNLSLGPAATWADSVRSETAFKFSAPFHFIDAEDNPPDSCSVNQARDCGDTGCIFTAIQNYTARVQKTSLGDEQVQEALKFITHFVGDIGQPLHVEALEVGGNDIDAICDGKKTNLHAAWDTGMLQKNLDASFNSDPQVWAAALTKEIKVLPSNPTMPHPLTKVQSGSFESDAADWASCISPSALSSTACPLVWAKEANSFDCVRAPLCLQVFQQLTICTPAVLQSDVFSFTTGEDLCDSAYYTAAIPIVRTVRLLGDAFADVLRPQITEQIAKQGFRLAKWLDAIFE